MNKGQVALALEWKAKNPSTPEEIYDFYVNTPNYEDDLNAWHETESRRVWTDIVRAAARANDSKRILDIGAGIGAELKALREQSEGYTLEAVEPNKHMQQALEVEGFSVYENMQAVPNEPYDLIICLDVLEHIPNPDVQILEPMINRLKKGGVFIEATATHDTSTPLHLTSLRGWSPARILDRYGFVIVEEFWEGRLRIWRRIFEKRPPDNNVLLCAYRDVNVQTSECLRRLTEQGWRGSTHMNDALISRVRSLAVSQWMQQDDGDVFLMVDADIQFTPSDANRVVELARKTRGIASAAYPVRGASHLASRFLKNDTQFGPNLEPIEIRWAGTGFLAAHRDVCEAIASTMHICIMSDQHWFWPMFKPFEWYNKKLGRWEYLSEDWAFCERARKLGFKVWLDRSIVLTHIGTKEYTIFDLTNASLSDAPTDWSSK